MLIPMEKIFTLFLTPQEIVVEMMNCDVRQKPEHKKPRRLIPIL